MGGVQRPHSTARSRRPTRLRTAEEVALGEQPWRIGESRVYVLPNSSGANASTAYAEKLEWWTRLRELVG